MDTLLFAPQTRTQLLSLSTALPHALLLTGAAGSGKLAVARMLAKEAKAEGVTEVAPDQKGTISIDDIRALYQRTRARQKGMQVVIIDHAEAMGIEAQNAFLKLLEEPRSGVVFILTTPTQEALLPTIVSRVQSVAILRCSHMQLQEFALKLRPELSAQELSQLLFVANGRPAVVARLVKSPEAFEQFKTIMKRAKELLGASQYERLLQVTKLAQNKEETVALLEAMARMVQIQLLSKPTPKWIAMAEGLETCLGRLAQNGNPRAQLTALFMSY